MFNDKYGLTNAVLKGKKTQTRRVVCIAGPIHNMNTGWGLEGKDKDRLLVMDGCRIVAKSHYAIGEVVAVAQRYKDCGYEPNMLQTTFIKKNGGVDVDGYRAFGVVDLPMIKHSAWSNKMFVRAELMPHHIRITNIRIERLQDISYEECLEEGIHRTKFGDSISYYFERGKNFYSARGAYATLIDKVSGKGSWDSNPWVFVYDFELVN